MPDRETKTGPAKSGSYLNRPRGIGRSEQLGTLCWAPWFGRGGLDAVVWTPWFGRRGLAPMFWALPCRRNLVAGTHHEDVLKAESVFRAFGRGEQVFGPLFQLAQKFDQVCRLGGRDVAQQ